MWTGTLVGGTRATAHCQGWTVSAASSTGLTGLGSYNTNQWTDSGVGGCDTLRQLYCFEE